MSKNKNNEPLLNTKRWIFGGIALIIGIFLFNGLINGTFNDVKRNSNDSEPTFYNTGNPKDMTEKELKEYLKWQEEQSEKENDNQKVFN